MKQEYIENHFLINTSWKDYFLSNFPNYTAENWTNDVWSLFERNEFIIKIKMYKHLDAVRCIDLYDTSLIHSENTDGWIFGLGDLTNKSALEQLLITTICDFYVDFSKFK